MMNRYEEEGGAMPAMHEVDYKIFGDDMQYVEVELDPGSQCCPESELKLESASELVSLNQELELELTRD